jgi:hypothetical protein
VRCLLYSHLIKWRVLEVGLLQDTVKVLDLGVYALPQYGITICGVSNAYGSTAGEVMHCRNLLTGCSECVAKLLLLCLLCCLPPIDNARRLTVNRFLLMWRVIVGSVGVGVGVHMCHGGCGRVYACGPHTVWVWGCGCVGASVGVCTAQSMHTIWHRRMWQVPAVSAWSKVVYTTSGNFPKKSTPPAECATQL